MFQFWFNPGRPIMCTELQGIHLILYFAQSYVLACMFADQLNSE
jgi:hypothetical protein